MTREIDWKARYIELENQIEDMMRATLELVESNENYKAANISRLLFSQMDQYIEVTAITKGNKPVFQFEVVSAETEEVLKFKSNSRKNSCKFNVENLENYRVKVSVKNEGDDVFSDVKVSTPLNCREAD